jgi:hypothetical protein
MGNKAGSVRGPYRKRDIADRFWSKVDRRGPDDCWMWTGCVGDGGYGQFRIAVGVAMKAHRQAFVFEKGPIADDLCACHSCDVRYPKGDITYRKCCNPAHLWAGTSAENTADMIAKGRAFHPSGEDAGNCHLSDMEVARMRALRKEDRRRWTLDALAQEFNVSSRHVWDLVNNNKRPAQKATS